MVNFNELGPTDRVVVRYRLDTPAADGATLSDALGYVVDVDATFVSLQTRGGLVRIARADITHAKTIGPPPQRRRPRNAAE